MDSSKLNEVDPLDMLFKARWNLPKAAEALCVEQDACKTMFEAYCRRKWNEGC